MQIYTVKWTRSRQLNGDSTKASDAIIGLRAAWKKADAITMEPGMEHAKPMVFDGHGNRVKRNGAIM